MSEGVGVFSRMKNLWRGFLSLWIEKVEAEHPEAVYEAAIQARIKQYGELKKAVSGLVFLRNKLQAQVEEKTRELKDVELQIPVAVQSGEDEVAILLLEKKERLTTELAGLHDELTRTEAQAEESKAGLISFQGEIKKLNAEKDTMLAKRANAEARIKIQESLEGMSTDADIKALDGVRESIHKLAAEADVNKEIGDQSLDSKLKKIKAQTASASARAQLDALKQSYAAQSGVAAGVDAKKTL